MSASPVVDDWDPREDLLGLIRALSAIAAPTGNEDRMTAAVEAYVQARGWPVQRDRLGQLAVSTGGEDADTSVMLIAHLDELGLVVRAIEDDGWLRVHRLGGMPERVLPGLRVVVHSRGGDLPAVVGIKSHHLTPPEEKYLAKPATDLYLDIGAGSAAEAWSAGVQIGDPITYAPGWTDFGGGRFSGKSLDNRVGVAAMLRVLDALAEEPPAAKVHVVFSCLEEFNLMGALAMAQRLQPDIALALDIVPATDTPDLLGQGSTVLGGGVSLSRLTFHGRGALAGLVPHPGLVRSLEHCAAEQGIAIQYDAVVGCLNDAAYLPMATAEGIAAISLGIPCRYTHSPVETAQLSDVIDAATLITAFARNPGRAELNRGAAQLWQDPPESS
jgi:putative aminopeptidase FrvX